MAAQKLSSRQKMINMMYLVLIAMLVLNVDKRVLKSFHTMEVSNIGATEALDAKNKIMIDRLSEMVQNDAEKAQPYYERALKAYGLVSEFNEYIERVKGEVEALYGGRLENEAGMNLLTELKTPDQFEKHSNYFLVLDNGIKAQELQNKINSTRDKLFDLLKIDGDSLFANEHALNAVKRSNQLSADEPTDNGLSERTWAEENLESLPGGALMAMLSQYQSNAQLLGSEVINKLLYGVTGQDYTFDELRAEVIPKSNYVMRGEEYEANILLVARSTTSDPDFIVNGEELANVERGIGRLKLPTNSIGIQEYSGTVKVLNPSTNEVDTFNFTREYQVFDPVATVSPKAMNLFYVGLDNPVSISVPGFSAQDVSVSISSGGRISGSNGNYMVKVDGTQRKVRINVSAKGRPMGGTEFRVRNIPEPRAQLGSIANDGRAARHEVAAMQPTIIASMGADFAYEMNWKVTSYEFIFIPKRGNYTRRRVNGSQVSSELRSLLRSADRGDILMIQDIRARDSRYGNEKSLSPVTMNLL